MLSSIGYRFENFYYFTQYYVVHHEYPPLPFCQSISIKILGSPNPHKFNYYFDIESRKKYTLPCLFSQVGFGKRNGSSVRKELKLIKIGCDCTSSYVRRSSAEIKMALKNSPRSSKHIKIKIRNKPLKSKGTIYSGDVTSPLSKSSLVIPE